MFKNSRQIFWKVNLVEDMSFVERFERAYFKDKKK